MNRAAIALGVLLCVGSLSRAAYAADDDASTTPSGWRYKLEPYAFVPANISGDATVRTRDIPFDVGFSQLFKKFIFGAEVRFEAWNGRFGLILDGTYLHVGQSGSLASVPLDWSSHVLVGDALFGIRPIVAPLGSEGAFIVEFDAGGRAAWLDVDATIGGDSFHSDRAFGRGVFGGRIPVRLSHAWLIGGRAYVTVPNPGWLALGWVEFDPSPCVTVSLGYQVEHLDWPSNQVSLDATAHGPYLAVGFPFGAGNIY